MSVRRRRIPSSVAFLQPFVDAGLFEPTEIHLVATMARLMPATPTDVLLALAVAARGPRLGHVCVHLADVASTVVGSDDDTEPAALVALPWPEPGAWIAAVEADAAAAEGIVAHPGTVAAPLRPLVFDGTRIYLQRYWAHERTVAESLSARARPHHHVDPAAVERVLDRYFPAGGPAAGSDGDTRAGALQRQAVRVALGSRLSVIAGGPGTGKTFTIARLLLAALDLRADGGGEPLRVALAAPTGKAANRMTAAVTAALAEAVPTGEDGIHIPEATTIHRLLGWAPGTEFAHNAAHPLDADLVVIDETSMVDLALMARLLDAVGPEARLVLVGDPYQLASVEAGTVLGDIVGAAADPTSPMAGVLTVLTRVHRFAEGSAIAEVAGLVRRGHTDVLLERLRRGSTAVPTTKAPHPRPAAGPVQQRLDLDGTASDDDDPDAAEPPVDTVDWVEPGDPDVLGQLTTRLAAAGVDVIHAAREGDGRAAARAAGAVKLLAATRRGPLGLYGWSDRIEKAIAELVPGLRRGERWYVGRPVLITANDPPTGVANGDVGVVVARAPDPAPGPVRVSEGSPDPATDGDPRSIALELKGELGYLPPARLDQVDTWWAMTIHKSQGSEFPEVIVSLPAAGSPILTRELLYTAVTRAQERVTIVASEESIRAAVDRPVTRASGLRERLGG